MHQIFGGLAKWPPYTEKFVGSGILASMISFLLSGALPAVSATRVLDFETALNVADSINPEIRNGLSRIRESQERKKQVVSNLLPQVSASANYSRLGFVPPGKKYLLGNSNNDLYTDVTVKQLLFAGGKYRTQISAADTLTVIENQKLLQVRRNIRLLVARAYFEAVKSRFAVTVQRDLIERTGAQLNIAELLFQSGKVSSLDVVRLRTQVLIAQGQQNAFESQLKTRQFQLAQAIGVIDTCSVADSVLTIAIDSLPININLLTQELKQTPEIQAAEAAREKALLDEKTAKADYLPTVSFAGGYNREESRFFPGNPNWIIGATVTVPIYRGGATMAQVAQANERIRQAEISIEQIAVSLTARMRSAVESVYDKKTKFGVSHQIVLSADETVRTAELRYSTGKLSTFELIDAQNLYTRAQQDEFNASVDYRLAIEELALICPSVLNTKEPKQ